MSAAQRGNNHERTRKSRKEEFVTPIFFARFRPFRGSLRLSFDLIPARRARGQREVSPLPCPSRASAGPFPFEMSVLEHLFNHGSTGVRSESRARAAAMSAERSGPRSRRHPSHLEPAYPGTVQHAQNCVRDITCRTYCAVAQERNGKLGRGSGMRIWGSQAHSGIVHAFDATKRRGPISTTIFGHPGRPRMSA
jgi:hypothetical protein